MSPFPPEYSLCLFVVFHWLRAFHLSSSLFSTPPTAQIKRRFLCHTTQGVVPHSLSCSSYSSFCDSSRSSLSPPIIPRCYPDPQTYNPPFRFLCVPLRPPRTSRPSWAESHRQRQAAAAPRAGGRVGCLPPTVFFFFFFFYKRERGRKHDKRQRNTTARRSCVVSPSQVKRQEARRDLAPTKAAELLECRVCLSGTLRRQQSTHGPARVWRVLYTA